ncbi:hypothetical protein [Streptomyces coffeae]|uniref:Uncharacterized protein n=1 Tax=Streptomyces coffeae TaxID=621382 RepID=A0ABS1NQR5_9ACTN|nr:hypothetical protein [Streptomyces coffeae]MBL1102101.1 hypothetical protein [Streptomyces coffeae]
MSSATAIPLTSADGLLPGNPTEHRPGLAPFRTRLVAAGHLPYGDNALAPAPVDGGGQP